MATFADQLLLTLAAITLCLVDILVCHLFSEKYFKICHIFGIITHLFFVFYRFGSLIMLEGLRIGGCTPWQYGIANWSQSFSIQRSCGYSIESIGPRYLNFYSVNWLYCLLSIFSLFTLFLFTFFF